MQLSTLNLSMTRPGIVPFSVASLFANNEQGVWYDPSDLTTLFQDAAGTTPVTAVEQPVGKMLDKSGRGNHAYQTTSANRPTLSARYNLLTKTEQFDDAAWTKTRVTATTNTTTAPDGTSTANTLTENTDSNNHYVWRGVTATAASYTTSVYAKANGRNWLYLDFSTGSGGAYFDLQNGVTGTVSAGYTATITSVGNNWYRCSITVTATAATWYFQAFLANANNSISYAGDGTSGIYIWGADLRVANDGVGIPAYQRVNTATDYDTVGFPKYLSFNGSSSAMMTNSITPGTDKAQVFAGVRKLGATGGMVTELDTQYATGNGKIALFSPTGDGANYHGFFSKGSNSSPATVNGYAPPVTNVITGLGDISGDSAILRVNNTQVASNTADQGTGNYLAYPLYIGARAGTSLWFNGRLYSMIVRFGSNLTTAQITNTEKYVNSKTKAY